MTFQEFNEQIENAPGTIGDSYPKGPQDIRDEPDVARRALEAIAKCEDGPRSHNAWLSILRGEMTRQQQRLAAILEGRCRG